MRSRLRLATSPLLAFATCASAQTYHDTSGTVPTPVVPLVGCSLNGPCVGPISATNPLPVSGAFSASLSSFTPGSAYAPTLSVSTSSSRVALPSGTVVVVYNIGSSAAFVTLGNSSVTATTAMDVIPQNSWMAFTAGSNTYLAAITSTGATALNISGGSGLPAGAGGGGGSGGSGSNASVGATGSSVPSSATYVGMNVGGNTAGLTGTSNGLKVDPSAVTQPISAASLPLPSGAATSANQATGNTSLATIAANTATTAAGTTASSAQAIQGVTNGVPVPVSGSIAVQGYDSGVVRVSATPGSGAHAAGQSVGGLFSIPIARVNGGSGIITTVQAYTSWNSQATYLLRLWQRNPVNTTCTDGSAFVGSNTDNAYLITPPLALQFNTPAPSTGDGNSYANQSAASIDYKNVDGTTTQNVYACLVTNASDTPGGSATLSVGLSGPQD
jgi:hypothetical protein